MNKKTAVSLKTIIKKEITRFMRIWTQTLLPPAITMTLYFVIFGQQIGSQISPIDGYTYMQYIAPGLTMMSIITSSYANTSSSFFGAKFNKSIEEMLVSSMSSSTILIGYILGGTIRGLLTGSIVIAIALCFTHLHLLHPGVMIVMAILAAILFSLAGLINGIFSKKFDDISFIPTFVLTPLTYLGGVFYSIHKLPPFWQKMSLLNPILSIVSTFRHGMLGISDIPVYSGFFLVCTLIFILFFWSLFLLRRGSGLKS